MAETESGLTFLALYPTHFFFTGCFICLSPPLDCNLLEFCHCAYTFFSSCKRLMATHCLTLNVVLTIMLGQPQLKSHFPSGPFLTTLFKIVPPPHRGFPKFQPCLFSSFYIYDHSVHVCILSWPNISTHVYSTCLLLSFSLQ